MQAGQILKLLRRKSKFRIVSVAMLLFMAAFNSYAEETYPEIRSLLSKEMSDLKIESVRKTDISGLYEVLSNGRIIYYHPESNRIILGEVLTTSGASLTAKRMDEVRQEVINKIPLEKAIKIGNGKNIVIEVADPDCPFCRKTAAFFKNREDITHYIFLYPIAQLHPDAERKAQYILCSNNADVAYNEVLAGKIDGADYAICSDPSIKIRLADHYKVAAQLGVQGTPALWINGQSIAGADIPRIRNLLGETVTN
ncbi:MAG: DsbC family protein [Deltaproteobacteria bacterium]|nr:DsbC family protein [Deltaproteobacteria bacterium]